MAASRARARLNNGKDRNMPQMTVVCPHCGSTGSYTHGFVNGPGTSFQQCKSCRKRFTVEIRNGQVYQVKQ